MLSHDTELACEHALDELRAELDNCSDSPLRNRIYAKINDLETFIGKLFSQEVKARKKDD